MTTDTLRPLLTTLGVQALGSMAVLTVPVLAPVASAEIGIAAAYVGIYIAVVYGASMASTLACGDMIRRYGAIRVSQACLLLAALGLLLAATGSLPLLVLSALAMGAGYGPITPASSHVLARTTPPERMSFVFSLKQTGVPLGGALAGATVPPMVALAGWRGALVASAAACATVALIAQGIRPSLDDDRQPRRRIGFGSVTGPMRVVFASTDLRTLAFYSFLFSAIQLCLVTYLVTYLTHDLGQTLLQAGLMLTVAQVGGMVARVSWGAIADRTGRPLAVLALVATGMAVASATSALFAPSWPLWTIAAVCAVFGATAIGWNGVFLAEVARRAPSGKAVEATGGALFFTYFGVLVAPPLFGVAVEHGLGYPLAYAALALPALLSGVLLWRWQRAGRSAMARGAAAP